MIQAEERLIHNNIVVDSTLKTISGIWLVVEDTIWNILLVLENYNKPWKKAGQLSVVFGEIERWETPFEALKRELPEETSLEIGKDIPSDKIRYKWDIHIVCKNWEECIKIKAIVFYVKVHPNILEKIKKFKNWEIKEVHITKLQKIKEMLPDKLRPWTIEAIYTAKKWDYPVVVNLEDWLYKKSYFQILKRFLEEGQDNVFS